MNLASYFQSMLLDHFLPHSIERFFELHKLNLSLICFPESSPRKKFRLMAAKAIRHQPLTFEGLTFERDLIPKVRNKIINGRYLLPAILRLRFRQLSKLSSNSRPRISAKSIIPFMILFLAFGIKSKKKSFKNQNLQIWG